MKIFMTIMTVFFELAVGALLVLAVLQIPIH